MHLQRRRFLKGLGIVTLVGAMPKFSMAVNTRRFSAVLHMAGGTPALPAGVAASAGLLLHQEGERLNLFGGELEHGEFWEVTGNRLIRVVANEGGNRIATGTPQPYIIREIGACRMGIIGLTLTGGVQEWIGQLGKIAERANRLKRVGGCHRVCCVVNTLPGSPLDEADTWKAAEKSRNIDQWFVTVQSDRPNKLKCLMDAEGNQLAVSVNTGKANCGQRIVYQSGRISAVDSNVPA